MEIDNCITRPCLECLEKCAFYQDGMKKEAKSMIETKDIQVGDFWFALEKPCRSSNSLPVISMYYDPTDYPEKYVARLFLVTPKGPTTTPYVIVSDSMAKIIEFIPPVMVPFNRTDEDDPKIVGTWI